MPSLPGNSHQTAITGKIKMFPVTRHLEESMPRVGNGSYCNCGSVPGLHDKGTGIELVAKPGEIYYVRVDIATGFWKGHGAVTLVDPQQGKFEVHQAAGAADQ